MKISVKNLNKDTISLKEFKEAVNFFADILFPRLKKNIKIDFVCEKIDYKGLTEWLDCGKKPRHFRISINQKFKKREILLIVAHEMVHVKQYATGELDGYYLGPNKISYKHKHYKERLIIDENKVHYFDTPHEIEAFGREYGLYIRFIERHKPGIY